MIAFPDRRWRWPVFQGLDHRRLEVYFGEHRIHLGDFRALSSRFPYAIYYHTNDGTRQVVAVLDLRRSPQWIRDQLTAR
ncbi:MAG: hypothetical protein WCP45_14570 [Verrucomicrobiota bacterium]